MGRLRRLAVRSDSCPSSPLARHPRPRGPRAPCSLLLQHNGRSPRERASLVAPRILSLAARHGAAPPPGGSLGFLSFVAARTSPSAPGASGAVLAPPAAQRTLTAGAGKPCRSANPEPRCASWGGSAAWRFARILVLRRRSHVTLGPGGLGRRARSSCSTTDAHRGSGQALW